MNPKKKFYETAAETLIKNLDKRGMEAYYVDNGEEALKMALRFVTPGSSVSWGGSMSINDIGLIPALKASDCIVLDRTVPKTEEEKMLKTRTKEVLSPANPNGPSDTICGIGGTNRALLSIANAYFKKPYGNNKITAEELKKLKKVILKKDDTAKKLILKNCPDRIHTIIPGMFITSEIVKIFGSSQILISKNGVREGYLCKRIIQNMI